MSPQDNISDALKDLLARLNPSSPFEQKKKDCGKNGSTCGFGCSTGSTGSTGSNCTKAKAAGISPSQILIVSAMLAGVLDVTSVLVDKNQSIEIVLTGSLRKKTELEKLLDQIGSKPFDEVIKALLGRLGD